MGLPFDQEDFFGRMIADLRGDGEAAERAQRLLKRYVPIGPNKGGADEWAAWWKSNQPYLFASDVGDYCWYIDPLAKKRGVPSIDLRGPKRADSAAAVATK